MYERANASAILHDAMKIPIFPDILLLYTQAHKEHLAQPSYGTMTGHPRHSVLEECKGFDPPNESRPPRLLLGGGDPNTPTKHRAMKAQQGKTGFRQEEEAT